MWANIKEWRFVSIPHIFNINIYMKHNKFIQVLYFSISHPFRGEYIRLQKNPKWQRIAMETNDINIVFCDIVLKINRKNGKVSEIIEYSRLKISFYFLKSQLYSSTLTPSQHLRYHTHYWKIKVTEFIGKETLQIL